MNSLNIKGLSKTYQNGIKALDSVSLTIPIGMYGLLGPNGAGKSTLMRTIATLQEADCGSIMMGDLDVFTDKMNLRKVLGYLPQQFGVYPQLSAQMLLNHLARLKGFTNSKEIEELVKYTLEKVNLFHHRKQKLGSFSGGMKQRFGIAQAILNNPKLLIVDEPTTGLDPQERNRLYDLLSEIAQTSIVILSTHIVDDVKQLCTQMAIINQGKVVSVGKPTSLMERMNGNIYYKSISKEELSSMLSNYQVINKRLFQGKPIVYIFNNGDPGNGFKPSEINLEDVYMAHIYNANSKDYV